jgi:hypothetical protein
MKNAPNRLLYLGYGLVIFLGLFILIGLINFVITSFR